MFDWLESGAMFVDVRLLCGTLAAVRFVEEWFSIPQRQMESVLGALYTLAMILVCWPARATLLLGLVNAAWCAGRVLQSDDSRARTIDATDMIFMRLVMSALFALLILSASLAGMARGFRWSDLCAITEAIAGMAFIFVTSLPASNGDHKGRRRKLALSKLKEMFGTSWMPLPEGGPA